ncbi:ATP-binding protein [Corynebacterium heidelbergense]|uniref:Acetyl/propionyl-CoA carboxylase subunit alpha n=1 Tax=Corynebacterium heidelbergense TaxID=2055947 RepID=A0A364V3N4_9CORY|nr:biotin carboxylase N-terminal domain-containing protein [Corynebacterium heidelbergense]RAV31243.1 acetyl/propionyl-CoA carboxylase subunit alpha [Corynebacterium heidelbergense]
MSTTLSAVLIANRGEIAVRIVRAARDLGIRSITVYSPVDREALHAHLADEAYALPGNPASESYLNVRALLDIARRAGADCVHPGYGFLSEDSAFARAVIEAGLVWIGPDPQTIDLLGDKIAARSLAADAGAPLAPGTSEPIGDWEQARDFAEEYGLPIAIKAAFGGGGRGLKVVDDIADIEQAFTSAGREARAAFGKGECYVEKFLANPRHVEAQVLADRHGTVRVIGTRDCSVQRRFQKLIEEAPAPDVADAQRSAIVEGARKICAAAGYVGAGTVEFIVAEDGTVSFLEVNTRIQVEHPVTEVVTGVDLVAEQFRIAAGGQLTMDADPIARGHGVEMRINAEDAANGFVPCPGTITELHLPTGPGVRVDTGVREGSPVPGFYDSLLAKVIVWGPDREVALRRARAAMREMHVGGVRTVIPFHRDVLNHPALAGDRLGVYTDWVDREYRPGEGGAYGARVGAEGSDGAEGSGDLEGREDVDVEAAYEERAHITIEIDGKLHRVGLPRRVLAVGGPGGAAPADVPEQGIDVAADPSDNNEEGTPVVCSYAGSLVAWHVGDGEDVSAGQRVATVEAMKMESALQAPTSGRIDCGEIDPGDPVDKGQVVARIHDR